ncbi:hypothetical protein RM697_12320 [Ichthyenterobacterium sp. W332]|uniref:2-dehydro-3-deoxyphosphooctonate aldolase n=1 Tax=Microcosmobacter mediterraneus TaxID=3075607 RepID=A0ABU2YMS4_9FLAO|nr:hypothetical protein [Ichthyenterobacterium sp. W332]MDT0559441.1 hypothetical protein [Ichthyenterobacterium sp. W332]
MKHLPKILLIIILLTSCGAKNPKIVSTSTNPTTKSSDHTPFFDISEYSDNEAYGLSGDHPVMVGDMSVANQRRYLASLSGPNGEEISFRRRGACCSYKSKNSSFGSSLVDVYEVLYDGLKNPILVYISFYDKETLYIPKGFTKRM